MNLRTKINLIKKVKITPEQIVFLEKIKILFNYDISISQDDFNDINDILNDKLEELIEKNEEENSIILAYIISTLDYNDISINLDFNNTIDNYNSIYSEENVDDFIDEIEGLSGKEQKALQKKAFIKYKEIEHNQIVNEFRDFILKKYPQILNGFDRSIYANAKVAYWKKEHIFDLWQIPTKVYEKIKDAEYKVEDILKEDIQKHSEKMFVYWYEDYKKWLAKNILTKSTKLNIKDFFKSIKVKPSETIVERIKEKYSKE